MTRILVLVALVASISAHAQATITTDAESSSLWAIAPSEKAEVDSKALTRLRSQGVNALVVTPAGRQALSLCSRHAAGVRCAALAASASSAQTMSGIPGKVRPPVAFYASTPTNLSQFASLISVRRHILVIAPLYATSNGKIWGSAISAASSAPGVDLGIAPVSTASSPSVQRSGATLAGRTLAGGRPPGVGRERTPVGGRGGTDTTPPSSPGNLSVSGVGQTAATLSWSASTDNVGVVGYRVYQGAAEVGTVTGTNFTFASLACATSYTLGVAAYDAGGNVSSIAPITASTLSCIGDSTPPSTPAVDTTAPSIPAGLSLGAAGQSSVTLSWNASTDNVFVTGYRVFRDGTQVATSLATSYIFGGLACGTSYTLGVAAVDAAGNVSGTASTSVAAAVCSDTSAPSTPAGLAVSGVGQTSVSLSWSASTDNVGVTGYRVFRAGSQVGTPSSTSYAFTGLACGASYTLGVAAVDAAGNVSGTASTSVATAACSDTSAPSAPAGLSTGAAGQSSVTLSWNASTDNVLVTGYRVVRDGTQVATSSSTSYIFGGLACGTSYTLGVAAVDAAGNVSGTASLSVSTAACSGDAAPKVHVSVSGNDSTCVRGDASKPCASLNAALALASAGDRVELQGGTYGSAFGCNSANVRGAFTVSRSFASAVTVVPAAGATVIIPCQIGVTGDHVGFDATGGTIKVDGFRADASFNFLISVDVFCQDAAPYPLYTVGTIDPRSPGSPPGGSHQFCSAPLRGNGDHFTMTGGSIGPTTTDCGPGLEDSSIGVGQGATRTATDWVIDGVWSHTARWGNDCNGIHEAAHTENFYFDSVEHFTIKDSVFTECGNSACVFVTRNCCTFDPTDVNFYGNVFADTSSISIDMGGSVSPSTALGTLAYNDLGSLNLSGGVINVSSNIATNNPCPDLGRSGVTVNYDHNLWIFDTSTGGSADSCSPTDVRYNVAHDPRTDIFVNWGTGNYHLNTGSNPALDIANPANTNLVSPDYFGQTRYCGTAPDAGAAERCP